MVLAMDPSAVDCRCCSPTKVHAGWEDDERTVWWVRGVGWPTMGEEVRLEWPEAINEQHTVIVFLKSVSPASGKPQKKLRGLQGLKWLKVA